MKYHQAITKLQALPSYVQPTEWSDKVIKVDEHLGLEGELNHWCSNHIAGIWDLSNISKKDYLTMFQTLRAPQFDVATESNSLVLVYLSCSDQ